MKVGKTNIGFFIAGLSIFSYLVYRFGIQHIVLNIEQAGWSLAYIIVVWCCIYLLNASAWKLVLGSSGEKVSFRRLFMVTVSGFVINYITPVIALGGEPYKVKALAPTLGSQRSLSAVVLYRMVHLLGHMLLLLAGIVTALLVLDLPIPVDMVLVLAAIAILGVIILTLAGHRGGVFNRLQRLLSKVRFLHRLDAMIEGQKGNVQEMDHIITDVYRYRRGMFYVATLLEFLSRALMGVEVYLILHGIGVETTIASALFLYVSYSIVINVLFFIPLNLGAREGGLALGLGSLALPPLLGVYLGIVMRIREFFWILLGLCFILLTTEREKTSSADVV